MLLRDVIMNFLSGVTDVYCNNNPRKIGITNGRHLYITDDEKDKILPKTFTKIHISSPRLIPYDWKTCTYSVYFIRLFSRCSNVFFSKAMEDYVSMQRASDIFTLIVKNSS
mgnify:CR=1 FL=1